MGHVNRRRFWQRKVTTQQSLPWASKQFYDHCTRCGDCIPACETDVIIKGEGGFPVVDFSRGECTYCQQCVQACRQAGVFEPCSSKAWSHQVRIRDDKCLTFKQVECRSCSDCCEAQAIRFPLRLGEQAQPNVDAEQCNGCGACIAVCPVQAIEVSQG